MDLRDFAEAPVLDLKSHGFGLMQYLKCFNRTKWAMTKTYKGMAIASSPSLDNRPTQAMLRMSLLQFGKVAEEFLQIYVRLKGDGFVNELHYLTRPFVKHCGNSFSTLHLPDSDLGLQLPILLNYHPRYMEIAKIKSSMRATNSHFIESSLELERMIDKRLSEVSNYFGSLTLSLYDHLFD